MIHCSIIYVPCIMTSYNTVRSVKELLQSHKSSPPSFTVKLYPDYWILNNGSKCLYNNPVAVCLPARCALPAGLTYVAMRSPYWTTSARNEYPWTSSRHLMPRTSRSMMVRP